MTDIAAAKAATEFMRDMHDDEAACRRIDDEIARRGDGGDQPADQAGRLDVRMNSGIDLFNPAIADAVIAPGRLREQRRLLQNQQIVAAAPAAIAHAEPPIIPGDQVDAGQDILNSQVIAATEAKGVGPQEQISARAQDARDVAAALLDVRIRHRRQRAARFWRAPSLPYWSRSSVLRCCGSKNSRRALASVGQSDSQQESSASPCLLCAGHDLPP